MITPKNIWQKIVAARGKRRLTKQAVTWAKGVIDAEQAARDDMRAEVKAHLAKLDAEVVRLRAKRDGLRARIKAQAVKINSQLKALGVPNADFIANPSTGSINDEQSSAILQDAVHFVNRSTYERAAEIAAAHGLKPPPADGFPWSN